MTITGMLIEFIAGQAPALKVSSHPLLSMPENTKRLEGGEVFYSQEKKWWFSRRAGKIKEIWTRRRRFLRRCCRRGKSMMPRMDVVCY